MDQAYLTSSHVSETACYSMASVASCCASQFSLLSLYLIKYLSPSSSDMTMQCSRYILGFLILHIFLIWLTAICDLMFIIIILLSNRLKALLVVLSPIIILMYSDAV